MAAGSSMLPASAPASPSYLSLVMTLRLGIITDCSSACAALQCSTGLPRRLFHRHSLGGPEHLAAAVARAAAAAATAAAAAVSPLFVTWWTPPQVAG